MKYKRILVFVFAAMLSVLLSACGGAPPATNWPGVASDGKNVYITNVSYVYTVHLSDGLPITVTNPDGSSAPMHFPAASDSNISFYTAPAFTPDGKMIVGNGLASGADLTPRLLYSLDPATDVQKWSFPESTGSWLSSVVIGSDTIYGASGDGKVYALALNGTKRWATQVSQQPLWSSPVTDGKHVFVGTVDHQLVALDAQTGQQTWKIDLNASLLASPALTADGTLYVGTIAGDLYALKSADGSKIWHVTLDGNIWSAPAVDGMQLYIGTSKGTAGTFYAINTADGTTAWTHDQPDSIIASPLVLPDQVIYVSDGGHVQSLNRNGTSKWVADIQGAKIDTAPILAGNLIIVAPMQTQFILAAYDQNGAQKWTFTPGK